jgi:hypothetical protein
MGSIAVTQNRREIIYCANYYEASAVRGFLTDYLDVRGLTDRLTIDVVAPAKGNCGWRVDLVTYQPVDALAFLALAGD